MNFLNFENSNPDQHTRALRVAWSDWQLIVTILNTDKLKIA